MVANRNSSANAHLATKSEEPQHRTLKQANREIRNDGSDVDRAHCRNDLSQWSEDRLTDSVCPPDPWRIWRDGQPRADNPDEQCDPNKVEYPRDKDLEDSARPVLYSECDRENFRAEKIEQAYEKDASDYNRGERPQWSARWTSTGANDFPFDRLENRIDFRSRESRDATEDVYPPRAHHPVDEAEYREYSRSDEHDKTNRAEYLIEDRES